MKHDPYQFIVQRLLDPLDLWRVGEARTIAYRREFEKSQFWSLEKIQASQLSQLQQLLAYAEQHCEYYRKTFSEVGFRASDLQRLEDIQKLPVLEKSHIQRNRDAMVSSAMASTAMFRNQTGGSTGAPISFYVSYDRKCSREAAARRHNEWAGWKVGDKNALVWGATPDIPVGGWKNRLRNWVLDRTLVLDTASVTDEKVRRFHGEFEQFRPSVILAYAKSLVLVTQRMLAEGLQVKHAPNSIITSAEMLTDADRQLLESFYRCKVFNRYGCREVSVIASECEQHNGLHIMAEGLYVEILNGDRPALPGEVGSVVVTDLRNFAMPLIRYRNGDMSSITFEPCACGRELPRLNSLEGRITDFVVAEDGSLVSGVFLATYLLADRPRLGQVQILQSQRKQVRFLVTGIGQSEKELQQDLQFLHESVAKHLGKNMQVEFEVVASIPNSASGKFTFCRSEIAADVAMSGQECVSANDN